MRLHSSRQKCPGQIRPGHFCGDINNIQAPPKKPPYFYRPEHSPRTLGTVTTIIITITQNMTMMMITVATLPPLHHCGESYG